MKAAAPAQNRKKMNSPTFVLPARKAPDTMAIMAGVAIPHFRPNLSAKYGKHKVPTTPPA